MPIPSVLCMYAFPWKQPGLLANHDGPDKWQIDFLTELGAEVKARNFDGHTPVNADPHDPSIRAWHREINSFRLADAVDHEHAAPLQRHRSPPTPRTSCRPRPGRHLQYWHKLSITRHWFEISTERMWMRDQKESWFVAAASHEEKNSEAFAGQQAADSTSFLHLR